MGGIWKNLYPAVLFKALTLLVKILYTTICANGKYYLLESISGFWILESGIWNLESRVGNTTNNSVLS